MFDDVWWFLGRARSANQGPCRERQTVEDVAVLTINPASLKTSWAGQRVFVQVVPTTEREIVGKLVHGILSIESKSFPSVCGSGK